MNHAIEWRTDALFLLDQRVLPQTTRAIRCRQYQEVCAAITDMVVRGAPAIGIAAAYALVLAARQALRDPRPEELLSTALAELAASRPTAVNLAWALQQLQPTIDQALKTKSLQELPAQLLDQATVLHEEDLAANRKMGDLGAQILCASGRQRVLTHCNTGMLATGGYGTALGVVRRAWCCGCIEHVYVDETRPWLQGSRLTAWELQREGIPFSLIADSAAAHVMKTYRPGCVIVGADRITANGDAANKIGTYALAVLARHHGVKFMVVAPRSTIDPDLLNGASVAIEERAAIELLSLQGQQLAPEGCDAYNPVFDVTPAELIDYLVTEQGVVEQPDARSMAELLHGPGN